MVPHMQVKNKALDMVQTWAHAFKDEQSYRVCCFARCRSYQANSTPVNINIISHRSLAQVVPDTYHALKMEGYHFPELDPQGAAMFKAEKAPAWVDGSECHRCRVAFGITRRRHHCRHCGQIFCSSCSAKVCIGLGRDGGGRRKEGFTDRRCCCVLLCRRP